MYAIIGVTIILAYISIFGVGLVIGYLYRTKHIESEGTSRQIGEASERNEEQENKSKKINEFLDRLIQFDGGDE